MTADCNLAIETSGRIGSVALGRGPRNSGGVLLATAAMPEQERHRVDLMPTIDRLCKAHGVGPRQIGEVYLSVGPGSFTGLRIGLATAKMLAQVLGAKVVAVPTVQVIACNVPPPPWHRPSGRSENTHRAEARCHESAPPPDAPRVAAGAKRSEGAVWTLLVCLNLKRDTVYAGRFVWDRDRWSLMEEPRLWTAGELLALVGNPGAVAIVGDPLPEAVMAAGKLTGPIVQSPETGVQSPDPHPNPLPQKGEGAKEALTLPESGGPKLSRPPDRIGTGEGGISPAAASSLTILPPELAQPHSEAVWRLGRAMAARGEFIDPLALAPIYARQPEAVELWERKLATDGHR